MSDTIHLVKLQGDAADAAVCNQTGQLLYTYNPNRTTCVYCKETEYYKTSVLELEIAYDGDLHAWFQRTIKVPS